MINIFIRKLGEHYSGFRVTGHANYAPEGKDIVCAAVSALTTTLENSLRMMVKVPVYERHYSKPGQPVYEFPVFNETIDILMYSYLIGIEGIEDEYPEYVTLHLET